MLIYFRFYAGFDFTGAGRRRPIFHMAILLPVLYRWRTGSIPAGDGSIPDIYRINSNWDSYGKGFETFSTPGAGPVPTSTQGEFESGDTEVILHNS